MSIKLVMYMFLVSSKLVRYKAKGMQKSDHSCSVDKSA